MNYTMFDLNDIARRVAVSIIDCEDFSIFTEDVAEGIENDSDYDSAIIAPGRYYRLSDCQCVNLGGIEDEYFDSLSDVLARMTIYHYDYFLSDTTEQFEEGNINEDTEDDYLWSVLCSKLLTSKVFYELINDIPCDLNISSQKISDDELRALRDYLYLVEPEKRTQIDFV